MDGRQRIGTLLTATQLGPQKPIGLPMGMFRDLPDIEVFLVGFTRPEE
jgi:hypothetical protein